jgi:hypothetical protein
MRKPSSTDTQRGLLALLVLALLASALTGCGIGPPTKQEKISETATTYLRALANADTAKACAQLTRGAKGEVCEAAMRKRLPLPLRPALGDVRGAMHGDRAGSPSVGAQCGMISTSIGKYCGAPPSGGGPPMTSPSAGPSFSSMKRSKASRDSQTS